MSAPKVHGGGFLAHSTYCGLPLRWAAPSEGGARQAAHNGKPIAVVGSRQSKEVTCKLCWRSMD